MGRIGKLLLYGATLRVRIVKPLDLPCRDPDGRIQYRLVTPESLPYLLVLDNLEADQVRLEPDPLYPDAPPAPDFLPCVVAHDAICDGEESFAIQVHSFVLRSH